MKTKNTLPKITVMYMGLFLLALLITAVLIPLIFWLEIYILSKLPETNNFGIEVGVADAMTMATILGALSVYMFDRYQSELHAQANGRGGGALRLMLNHIREEQTPQTINNLWTKFVNDDKGREIYCEGYFKDITLEQFTAEMYALKMEGHIDFSHNGYVFLRTPYNVFGRRGTEQEKRKICAVLTEIAKDTTQSEYTRTQAISELAAFNDVTLIPFIERFLEDNNTDVKLASAKALSRLLIFDNE